MPYQSPFSYRWNPSVDLPDQNGVSPAGLRAEAVGVSDNNRIHPTPGSDDLASGAGRAVMFEIFCAIPDLNDLSTTTPTAIFSGSQTDDSGLLISAIRVSDISADANSTVSFTVSSNNTQLTVRRTISAGEWFHIVIDYAPLFFGIRRLRILVGSVGRNIYGEDIAASLSIGEYDRQEGGAFYASFLTPAPPIYLYGNVTPGSPRFAGIGSSGGPGSTSQFLPFPGLISEVRLWSITGNDPAVASTNQGVESFIIQNRSRFVSGRDIGDDSIIYTTGINSNGSWTSSSPVLRHNWRLNDEENIGGGWSAPGIFDAGLFPTIAWTRFGGGSSLYTTTVMGEPAHPWLSALFPETYTQSIAEESPSVSEPIQTGKGHFNGVSEKSLPTVSIASEFVDTAFDFVVLAVDPPAGNEISAVSSVDRTCTFNRAVADAPDVEDDFALAYKMDFVDATSTPERLGYESVAETEKQTTQPAQTLLPAFDEDILSGLRREYDISEGVPTASSLALSDLRSPEDRSDLNLLLAFYRQTKLVSRSVIGNEYSVVSEAESLRRAPSERDDLVQATEEVELSLAIEVSDALQAPSEDALASQESEYPSSSQESFSAASDVDSPASFSRGSSRQYNYSSIGLEDVLFSRLAGDAPDPLGTYLNPFDLAIDDLTRSYGEAPADLDEGVSESPSSIRVSPSESDDAQVLAGDLAITFYIAVDSVAEEEPSSSSEVFDILGEFIGLPTITDLGLPVLELIPTRLVSVSGVEDLALTPSSEANSTRLAAGGSASETPALLTESPDTRFVRPDSIFYELGYSASRETIARYVNAVADGPFEVISDDVFETHNDSFSALAQNLLIPISLELASAETRYSSTPVEPQLLPSETPAFGLAFGATETAQILDDETISTAGFAVGESESFSLTSSADFVVRYAVGVFEIPADPQSFVLSNLDAVFTGSPEPEFFELGPEIADAVTVFDESALGDLNLIPLQGAQTRPRFASGIYSQIQPDEESVNVTMRWFSGRTEVFELPPEDIDISVDFETGISEAYEIDLDQADPSGNFSESSSDSYEIASEIAISRYRTEQRILWLLSRPAETLTRVHIATTESESFHALIPDQTASVPQFYSDSDYLVDPESVAISNFVIHQGISETFEAIEDIEEARNDSYLARDLRVVADEFITFTKISTVTASSGGGAGSGASSSYRADSPTIDALPVPVEDPIEVAGVSIGLIIDEWDDMPLSLYRQEDLVAVEDIWNEALTLVGAPTIVSVSDGSPEADIIAPIWDNFRCEFIADHTWNGAVTIATLEKKLDASGAEVTAPKGWSYVYELPDDYCRAWRVNGDLAGPNENVYWAIKPLKIDGTYVRVMLASPSSVELEYIFDVGEQLTLLSAQTRSAMAYALAVKIAARMGLSEGEIQGLSQRASVKIAEAKGSDGQEGTPIYFPDTSLLEARNRRRWRS